MVEDAKAMVEQGASITSTPRAHHICVLRIRQLPHFTYIVDSPYLSLRVGQQYSADINHSLEKLLDLHVTHEGSVLREDIPIYDVQN